MLIGRVFPLYFVSGTMLNMLVLVLVLIVTKHMQILFSLIAIRYRRFLLLSIENALKGNYVNNIIDKILILENEELS